MKLFLFLYIMLSHRRNEPLHEMLTGESATGMSSHVSYDINIDYYFELMVSNLGPTTVSSNKIGLFRKVWDNYHGIDYDSIVYSR